MSTTVTLDQIRTAAAGAVSARHLSPSTVDRIGVLGAGTQARVQLDQFCAVTACRDVVVVDSLTQSESRGEVYQAVSEGAISRNEVLELGAVIAGNAVGRTNDSQITVCDLTGVAVQDLQIAGAVYEAVAGEANRRPR